ncbi:MAG: NUDIX pyrophosphatase [Thermoplasmatales archaeon]|nr:MAG: NUDIX pyrophosphatase [Thermoplasmatales archaeon]
MPRVVTCILEHNGKLLILKRSDKVRTYKGLWGGVAGYVEEDETPYKAAVKEIKEEVGIEKNDIRLIKKCKPVRLTDFYEGEKYDWIIYSFLFTIEKKDKVKIDWEHTEFRWISPSEIEKYDTVPHLREIVSKIFK